MNLSQFINDEDNFFEQPGHESSKKMKEKIKKYLKNETIEWEFPLNVQNPSKGFPPCWEPW